MPSRRHHAKSRNGCVQCKKSHVKCDEIVPQCGYCVRRQMRCSLSTRDDSGTPGRSRDGTPNLLSSQGIRPGSTQAPGRSPIYTSGPATVPLPARDASQMIPHNQHHPLNVQSNHIVEYASVHSSAQTPSESPGQSSVYTSRQPSTAGSEYHNLPPIKTVRRERVKPKSLSLRGREGFLLHHFATSTQNTFYEGAYSIEIWEGAMMSEAFKHDFLLDALLGLAALHCASLFPEEGADWSEVAIEYQSRALASFSLIIANITPEACHAAFGFSIIIMFLTFAMPFPDFTDPVEFCLVGRNNIQGIGAVAYQSEQTLKEGGFAAWLQLDDTKKPIFRKVPGDEVRAALERLNLINEGTSQNISYKAAIAGLNRSARKFALDLVAWPATAVDDHFISLLRNHEPMALLIVAHYGVLLHYLDLDGRWWARGVGRSHVDGMTTLLMKGKPSADIVASAEWARAHVGLKIEPMGNV